MFIGKIFFKNGGMEWSGNYSGTGAKSESFIITFFIRLHNNFGYHFGSLIGWFQTVQT